MDVLFPKIGEIIGGSQREEDYDKLHARINEMGIPEKDMWWYLETRMYGTVPHSGFGLGFRTTYTFYYRHGKHQGCNSFPEDTAKCRILMDNYHFLFEILPFFQKKVLYS